MTGPSIPDTATGTVTPTPEMWQLRPALFKLACWLYATHPIGVPLEISNGTIGRAVGLSEGTVSDAMPELESLGYLHRVWDASLAHGRGRYVTTLETPPGSAHDPLAAGSTDDPSVADPTPDSSTMPEKPHRAAEDRQSILATNMESHDQDQEEESPRARAKRPTALPCPWVELGVEPPIVPEIQAYGVPLDRFRAWVESLQQKPWVREPVGYAIWQLRRGASVPAIERHEEMHHGAPATARAAQSGRRAAPDRRSRSAWSRGAAPPQRTPVEQPAPAFACIDDLGPGYTLEQLLGMCGGGGLPGLAAAGGG